MSKRLSNRGYRALELEYLMMDKESISSSSGAPDNMVTFKQIAVDRTRHNAWFAVAAEEGFPRLRSVAPYV